MARPRSPTDRWLCWAEPSAVDQLSWILLPCVIPTLILPPFTVCECSDRFDHHPAGSTGGDDSSLLLVLMWQRQNAVLDRRFCPSSCLLPWMSFLALPEIEQQGKPFIVHLKPQRQSVGSYTFLKSNRHKNPPNHQKDFFTAKRI